MRFADLWNLFFFLVLFGFVSLLSLLSTETKQVAQVQSRKHDEQVESHNMQSQLQLLFCLRASSTVMFQTFWYSEAECIIWPTVM